MQTVACRRRISRFDLYGQPIIVAAAAAIASQIVWLSLHADTPDFSIFYGSAVAILRGEDPYASHVNLNAPATNLLFLPFAVFPLRVAHLLWELTGIAALVASARLIAREVLPRRANAIAALVLLTQAGLANLWTGQLGFLLMLGYTAAWIADRRGRTIAAGAILGPIVYAKPFLLVFVVYFGARRQWRALAALAAAAAITAVVGVAAFGFAVHASWLATLHMIVWEANAWNTSVHAILLRAFVGAPWISNAPALQLTPTALHGAAAVIVAALFAAGAWQLRPAGCRDAEWGALLLLALLASPLGWVYYLPMAAGPLIAIWSRETSRFRNAFACGAVVLLSVSKLTIIAPATVLTAVTLGSIHFWGVLALYAYVLLSRRVAGRSCHTAEPLAGSTLWRGRSPAAV